MDIQEIKQLKDTTEKEINGILSSYYKATGLMVKSISIENIMSEDRSTGEEYLLLQRSTLNIEL